MRSRLPAPPARRRLGGLAGQLILLVASGGCLANGDGSTGVTGMMMTVDSRSGTLAQGASRNIKVTLTRNQGSVSEIVVSVQDLPAGVTATISPPLTVGTISERTISLQAAAPVAGTYVLTIRASAEGLSDATITYTLVVL